MTHRRTSINVITRVLPAFIALAAVVPRPLPAQRAVPVSGRISIVEREGESTTDLGNTVIYLVPLDTASPAMAPQRTSIAMNGRAFVPRLRVISPDSRVSFPNQDPFSHNIFSTTPGTAFDLGLYPAGKAKEVRFRRTGAFPVYCNIHPRMTAFVVVVPTPWFAQAGNDGRWTVEGVPPGRYALHVWHERTKDVETEVTVTASGVSGLATQLDARGFRFAPHKNKFGKEYDKTGKDRY